MPDFANYGELFKANGSIIIWKSGYMHAYNKPELSENEHDRGGFRLTRVLMKCFGQSNDWFIGISNEELGTFNMIMTRYISNV